MEEVKKEPLSIVEMAGLILKLCEKISKEGLKVHD